MRVKGGLSTYAQSICYTFLAIEVSVPTEEQRLQEAEAQRSLVDFSKISQTGKGRPFSTTQAGPQTQEITNSSCLLGQFLTVVTMYWVISMCHALA